MHRAVTLNRTRALAMVFALTAGLATAGLLGVAVAKTFTLKVRNVMVDSSRQNVVVTSRGLTVYDLTGDSKQHPKCTTTTCLQFWPAVKVASAKGLSKAPGVKGKLGVWKHNGFLQVTLNGHPLYRYSGDTKPGTAMGEGIKSFGGTWHVIKAAASSSGGGSGSGGTGSTSTTTTTTTTPGYPGYPGYP